MYIRNGSIYVVKTDVLRTGHFFIGQDLVIRPHIMPPERGLNIDTELDLMLAKVMLEKGEICKYC